MASFTNWSHDVRAFPREIARPRGPDELIACLDRARHHGRRLKVVGGGHSWSALAATDDIQLCLDDWRAAPTVDPAKRTVTVSAGMRLHALNDVLARHRLGLSVHGSIDRQAIAGVLATATHGTGVAYPSLSSQVTEIVLHSADGTQHRLSRAGRPDWFAAAACHLGALGVLTEVTLQCEPAFRLHCVEERLPWEAALDRLDTDLASNQHVKLWWVPHTDWVVLFRQNRTDAPVRRDRVGDWVRHNVLRGPGLEALLWWGSRTPGRMHRAAKIIAEGSPRRLEYVDRSDKVFAFPVHVRHQECEYAFPREHAVTALRGVREAIERNRWDVGFIVEMRFVAGEDIWLSPAYQRDSCYMGVMQYRDLPHEPYFRAFESLVAPWEGRPHWGKFHFQEARSLARLYPRWDAFQAVRQAADPQRCFTNAYLQRVLGS